MKKGLGHLRADRVASKIIGAGIATTVTKETRERLEAAGFKRRAQYVFCLKGGHAFQCSVLRIETPTD